jgi:peptidyl-prolyl cis-trans isomerase B (cyclophilin B)
VATKKERQRRLARERYERRQRRRADRDKRAKRWAAGSIAALLVAGVGVGAAYLVNASSGPSTPAASASRTPSASPSASASPAVTSAMVGGKCIYTATGNAARKVNLPPTSPVTGSYRATIATNRGNIVINLLASKAPCTVNSFVSLAIQKYFNVTPCHRLTTSGIYVLQCGDPTGTGTGSPGYEFYTENLTGATYPAGTVAMARSLQSNDSNGSQFFLVYKKTNLPPSYTPFGTIVNGLNIIQNVAKAGTDNSNGAGDGHPKEKVEIKSVTIKKT